MYSLWLIVHFFLYPDLSEETLQRLTSREVCLTAPLWGAGELTSADDAKQYELELFN